MGETLKKHNHLNSLIENIFFNTCTGKNNKVEMDFKNVHYLKDGDYLPLVYKMLFIFPNNKKVRRIMMTVFTIRVSSTIVDTYFFLTSFSFANLIKYGPAYFAGLYTIFSFFICIVLCTIYTPRIQAFKNTFYWSMEMASPKLRAYMMGLIKKYQSIFIAELIAVELVVFYYMYYIYNCTQDFIVTSNWIYSISPVFMQISQHLMMFDVSLMFLPMMSAMWYAQYVCISLGAQLYMLADNLRYLHVKRIKERDITNYVSSKEHQVYVREYLKFFIERHQRILSYANFVTETNSFYNFFYLLCAFCIWLFMALILFSEKYDWFLAIYANITFWTIITLTMNDCETFEDTSRQLALALYDAPFHLWNVENMKTLMIAHQYLSCRVIHTPMVSFITANMSVVAWFAKAMYTAFNIYRTMNSK